MVVLCGGSFAPAFIPYQGFVWDINGEERYFQDNCLCLGLKCAPYIFSRLTEFIVCCMDRRGYSGIFGYLDDFHIVAETKEACEEKLQILIALFRYLGFAIAWDKLVSPAQVVTYLGIELYSVCMEFRLPSRKVIRLTAIVKEFLSLDKATKRELQVKAGYLSHASTVVKGGRTFSRRLLNFIVTTVPLSVCYGGAKPLGPCGHSKFVACG